MSDEKRAVPGLPRGIWTGDNGRMVCHECAGGQLCPQFVEAIMGLPRGWTDPG